MYDQSLVRGAHTFAHESNFDPLCHFELFESGYDAEHEIFSLQDALSSMMVSVVPINERIHNAEVLRISSRRLMMFAKPQMKVEILNALAAEDVYLVEREIETRTSEQAWWKVSHVQGW